ncbi:MAG TPA: peptidoglycan DD-metalloendopeptidase family protein, partial [Pseudomonadales bacterium]|nr:peptidoglycan DD-metalloendopeptidase family protein [Pseudomonadales bacterium]
LQTDQTALQSLIEKIQAEEKARAEAEAARKREEEARKAAQANKKSAPEPEQPAIQGNQGQDAEIDIPRTTGKLVSDSGGRGADTVPFRLAHGKLPWPAKGRIIARFGQSREQGKLVWDGTLIQAPSGTPVRAIHSGTVELAQYLRGYGFIVILDHGGGYMSVYAYNESLARKKGDRVNAGDVIAAVGNTGGQAVPALYFQIRYNGQAVDPAGWCR